MTPQSKESKKLTLIEGGKEKCSSCNSYEVELSYGMACGGIGAYMICFGCQNVFGFKPDHEDE